MDTINDLPLHWYAWTFANSDESGLVFGQSFIGYADQQLNLRRVTDAKVTANVPMTAVLTSVTYMGFMSQAEMIQNMGDEDE